MMRSRHIFSALTLAITLFAPVRLEATNGSNYIHLINGIDASVAFYNAPGSHSGMWRCFPADMLHAPTLSLIGPQAGTYATKIKAIHLNVSASVGSTIDFPTIALSSSKGKCDFLDTGGSPNFGTLVVPGLGTIVAGPLTGNTGPEPVHVLAGIAGTSLANPAATPFTVVQVCLNLVGIFGQSIDVPVDESLVLWAQDDPNQLGPGNRQYWTASTDERNLCSGYSFLISGSGVMYKAPNNIEWGIGFGTVDASLSAAIRSLGPGSVHDVSNGFNPGFDAGSGTRTISLSNAANEFVAFNIYDENGPSNRLTVLNCEGVNIGPTCSKRVASYVPFPTGGPGGPVLLAIPEMPRSVGKIDVCTTLIGFGVPWIAAANHATVFGGNNNPYIPVPALNGGSNAGGNVGGSPWPMAAFGPPIVGVCLYFWSFNVDPTNAFLDPGAASGHKLTNGYPVLFFP